ncbi:MAG: bacteriohemerythrin [Gammaproteobacteria bacterium]|nr:bacteriohemerythrin [Gammaproteobacteria bacterium]MBT4331321.1 bacteriohemerythrin [Gammaproteobacteria bacterium]MBT4811430.1 bacteriohemerythrin [Thiotrichales bacterium]MBT5371658.1 bacteriohemerythrin [Gammaproteobacteria bacterium]MBT6080690.1 bacteriohemerythrin [Gammaproteobacteria bacterium]
MANSDSMLVWGEQYLTGIPKVDEQHQKLVNLINALSLIVNKESSVTLQSIQQELDYYISGHLVYEESLLDRYGFSDGEVHRQQHQKFVEQLKQIRAEGTAEVLLNYLKQWITQHVLGSDMKYVEFITMKMKAEATQPLQHKSRVKVIAIDDEPEVLNSYSAIFRKREQKRRSQIENNLFATAEEIEVEVENSEQQSEFKDGFELATAAQGEAGVAMVTAALAEGIPFMVALIDMRMPPGIDGLETAKRLRQLDSRIHIVFVTAFADHSVDDIDQAILHDVLYLRKPFLSEEILQVARSQGRSWHKDRKLEASVSRTEMETVERASQQKDQFFTAITHELRTPLTAMIGNSEILSEMISEPEEQNLLRSIEVSGHGLLALINDILDISKIEAGKFSIDQTDYELKMLLEEIHYIFSARAADAGLEFTIDQTFTLKQQLIGDSRRIGQILINLIGNAIKFTRKGSVKLTVTVSESQQWINFSIDDQGIGMEPEVVQRLFQPFEQASQSISEHYGGTGLGLHISKTLAELMGGEIAVESEIGKGSIFTLKIPYQLSTREVMVDPKHEHVISRSGSYSGHVLVAEDDPGLRLLMRRLLTMDGVKVSTAADGNEVLEQALKQSFDLILMDMQMPGTDGLEATRLLRQSSYKRPIVALTGNTSTQHQQQFSAAGCDGFLEKPVDRQRLNQVLEEYLQIDNGKVEFIDIPAVNKVMQVDEDLKQVFILDMASRCEHLSEAYREKKWDEVGWISHSIKGMGSSFGYPELTKLCTTLSEQLKDEDKEGSFELVEQLIIELRKLSP